MPPAGTGTTGTRVPPLLLVLVLQYYPGSCLVPTGKRSNTVRLILIVRRRARAPGGPGARRCRDHDELRMIRPRRRHRAPSSLSSSFKLRRARVAAQAQAHHWPGTQAQAGMPVIAPACARRQCRSQCGADRDSDSGCLSFRLSLSPRLTVTLVC
eukprot:636988-Rhodomonas_salina.1